MQENDDLKEKALYLIDKHKVTAYEIEKNIQISAVGIQKIIDGKTKKPQSRTLEAIISYITNKYERGFSKSENVMEEKRSAYEMPKNQLQEKERVIIFLEKHLLDKDIIINLQNDKINFQIEKIKELESSLTDMKSRNPLAKETHK